MMHEPDSYHISVVIGLQLLLLLSETFALAFFFQGTSLPILNDLRCFSGVFPASFVPYHPSHYVIALVHRYHPCKLRNLYTIRHILFMQSLDHELRFVLARLCHEIGYPRLEARN